jgi:hypothetical protein
LAYAGESNIPSRYVVNDDGNEEIEDAGDADEPWGGLALAKVDDSAPAPIVATDPVGTAPVESGTCFP